ncbi:phage late control D family protein [Azohydromonas caseinilytica]|uniref:Phage protein D n=1 Tax=Azohydromonas caseinilytica TaxID=2728836 RepID=A0A848FEQ3_9BURK|nr:hypothetical protein [Azohydromonas caseinilytica]NML16829.1 hypothetical protein [Azohydromonas caseinilytica]
MPTARYRVFVDDAPLGQAQLDLVRAVRVEQAIGLAAAAELELVLGTDDQGAWQGFDDAPAQPFARVRVELSPAEEAPFVPLIDGPVVGQRFELEAAPDASRLIAVVHDDSVLLDREEKVVVFKDEPLARLVRGLIEEGGLTARVSASLPDAASALERWIVQRGTNMQLLRTLARRLGMFAWVEPGESPGRSVGVFEALAAQDEGLPDLVLLGQARNLGRFSASFDALRPQAPRAAAVQLVDKRQLSARADQAGDPALGEEAAHGLVEPAATLLAHTREEQGDVDAATAAGANLSAWAYRAEGEVDSDLYPAVLRPHRRLRVTGVGPQLSGDYLVSRVLHHIDDAGYRQRFTLARNARSAAGAGGLGGLLSGVF